MGNLDLFDFQFVNRDDEQKLLAKYLKGTRFNKKDYTIWINGDHGVGKSFFTKHVLNSIKLDATTIFVNRPFDSQKSYLKHFIEELNKIQKVSLINFCRNNYKSLITSSGKIASSILKIQNVDDNDLLSTIAESVFLFESKSSKEESVTNFLCTYLYEINKSTQKDIVIVLDNFTNIDKESLKIIQGVISRLYHKAPFTFITITTSTELELEKNKNIKKYLAEQVEHRPIWIKSFDQCSYYKEILDSKFGNVSSKYVNLLFELSNGNPEELKNLLISLYLNEAIDKDHRLIETRLTEELLSNKNFFIRNLNPFEQTILRLLIALRIRYSEKIFGKLISYLGRIDSNFALNSIDVYRILNKNINRLIDLKILDRESFNFTHDTIFKRVEKYFEDTEPFMGMLYHYLFLFVEENEAIFIQEGYSYTELLHLKAFYSYKSKLPDWHTINITYMNNRFQSKRYFDTIEIGDRLRTDNKLQNLSETEMLSYATALFETGNYLNCEKVLNNYENKIKGNKFIFLLLRSRNFYNMLETHKAVKYAKDCLNSNDDVIKLKAYSLLYISYSEINGFEDEARTLFYSVTSEYKDYEEDAIVSLLRNCQNITSGREAIAFLKRAKTICKGFGLRVESSKIIHNIGYEYQRNGKRNIAIKYYKEALKYLKRVKPHESAYTLVNIGLQFLIDGNPKNAQLCFCEAKALVSTLYGQVVCLVNLMLAYYYLNEDDKLYRTMDELIDFLEQKEVVDSRIFRKSYLNLFFVTYNKGINDSNEFLNLAEPHIKNSSSLIRYNRYREQLNNGIVSITPNEEIKSSMDYFKECLEFEPWGVIYAHD